MLRVMKRKQLEKTPMWRAFKIVHYAIALMPKAMAIMRKELPHMQKEGLIKHWGTFPMQKAHSPPQADLPLTRKATALAQTD